MLTIGRNAQQIVLASPEQVAEIERLIEAVRVPDALLDKWKAAAGASEWEDFEADKLEKCIAELKKRISQA